MKMILLLTIILAICLIKTGDATVKFDEQIIPDRMLFKNSSGWNNFSKGSSINYDNWTFMIENGTTLAVGWQKAVFHNLSINITSPLTGSPRIDWYYSSATGTGTSCIPAYMKRYPLTIKYDTTNNFTQSGSIEFDIPNNFTAITGACFAPYTIYTTSGIYIFANFSNINARTQLIVNGTRINNYALRIDNGSYTIETLFRNDTALGSPCMTKKNSYYSLMCNLIIGTDLIFSTSNSANDVNLTISDYSFLEIGNETNLRTIIMPKRNNKLTIGNYDNITDVSRRGSAVKVWDHLFYEGGGSNSIYSDLEVYNSLLLLNKPYVNDMLVGYKADIRNSIIETFGNMTWDYWYVATEATGNIKNTILAFSSFYYYSTNGLLTLDNLIFGYTNTVVLGAKDTDLKNTDLKNTIQLSITNSRQTYTTDCKNINYSRINVGTGSNLTVRYNLYLNFVNESGEEITNVNTKISDAYNNLIFDGIYSSPTVINTYKKVKTSLGVETQYNYNPIKIEITKSEFLNNTLVFNLTENTQRLTIPLINNASYGGSGGEILTGLNECINLPFSEEMSDRLTNRNYCNLIENKLSRRTNE